MFLKFVSKVGCLSLLFGLLASPALADSACVNLLGGSSGSLSAVDGQSCYIGTLDFTFTGLSGANSSYNTDTSTYNYDTPWTDGEFTFTVLSNGFELSGPPAQTISAGVDENLVDSAALDFNVTDLSGDITGVSFSSAATLSASGTASNSSSCASQVLTIEGLIYHSNEVCIDTGGSGIPTTLTEVSTGSVVSGWGYAMPFDLGAESGMTASISSTTTDFTFETSIPHAVPEPGTLILLATGLLGLAGTVRRRLFS